MKKIIESLNSIKGAGLYPVIKTIEGCPTNPEVTIEGRKVLMFCSNNYLGLANNESLKKNLIEATTKYGVGSGGSRLVSGNTDIQLELEKYTAKLKNTESAISFATGYMVNLGVISAIMDPISLSSLEYIKNKITTKFSPSGIILSDTLNHASIVDGARLSKAKIITYSHKNMRDLETKLKKHKKKRKLIVSDGVFSMDGDIAPVPQIVKLAKKYNAITMIDDAHATGVLGDHGGGTSDYFHLNSSDVDIMMGTYTKAMGAIGGFIAGQKELIDYLRIAVRTYIFTAPITPGNAAAIIAAIKHIRNNKETRDTLWYNTEYLRKKLHNNGFNTLGSETPIIPILIGDEKKGIEVSKKLFDRGILAPCIRWPAVPKKQSRLRLTVMSTHTKEQIDYLVTTLVKINKDLEFTSR
ncbi:8-amino-7-oxononanoate synthase [Patescibacteria group bacterium]